MTASKRLPRRKVVAYGERRQIVRPGARYGFLVDVLSCGHEVYADDRRPVTRGCPYCPEGLPSGFHPRALRSDPEARMSRPDHHDSEGADR